MVVQLSPHPLSHTLTLVLSLTSSSWTRSKHHSPHHPATQWSHVLGSFHSHLPSYHMHTHTHPYPPNTHPHTKMYIHCNSHTTIPTVDITSLSSTHTTYIHTCTEHYAVQTQITKLSTTYTAMTQVSIDDNSFLLPTENQQITCQEHTNCTTRTTILTADTT